jgi:hypothetical protein
LKINLPTNLTREEAVDVVFTPPLPGMELPTPSTS